MIEWLQIFSQINEGITLILNGKTYNKSACVKLGEGHEKRVYKIKGTNQCFFIPNRLMDAKDWDRLISKEKLLLDYMTDLGLKTQRFEIVSLEINEPGKPPQAIKVLLTKDFNSLCEEESIVIHNPKGGMDRNSGDIPDFLAMREQIMDPTFSQKMLGKMIIEYAVSLTFSLPISSVGLNDDSEHYCFELPKDSDEPPLAHYMFWDVVGDFSPRLPIVPTLKVLKKGYSTAFDERDDYGLYQLANSLSCAILSLTHQQCRDTGKTLEYGAGEDFRMEVQNGLVAALKDESFLKPALEIARMCAVEYLNKVVVEKEGQAVNSQSFVDLLTSVISTGDLDLLARTIKLNPNLANLSANNIKAIKEFAKKYDNQDVDDYLNDNLFSVYLKNRFLGEYQAKLLSDKSAWCGFYSSIARSYVRMDMSLQELVKHAQGLSREGTGARSNSVMKGLGWLDENNQVSGELKSLEFKI